jgi:hypothetical protein
MKPPRFRVRIVLIGIALIAIAILLGLESSRYGEWRQYAEMETLNNKLILNFEADGKAMKDAGYPVPPHLRDESIRKLKVDRDLFSRLRQRNERVWYRLLDGLDEP